MQRSVENAFARRAFLHTLTLLVHCRDAAVDIGEVRGPSITGRTLVVPTTVTDFFGDGVDTDLVVVVEAPDGEESEARVVRGGRTGSYHILFQTDQASGHILTVLADGVEIGSAVIEVEPRPGR